MFGWGIIKVGWDEYVLVFEVLLAADDGDDNLVG
jgi:hypothetical protein